MSKNFNPNHKILKNALYLLGRNKRIRVSFINFLKKSEKYLNHKGSRRDEIIGPIVFLISIFLSAGYYLICNKYDMKVKAS